MKYKLVKCHEWWLDEDESTIDEESFVIGRCYTYDELRNGFDSTLKDWCGSVRMLNTLLNNEFSLNVYKYDEDISGFEFEFVENE